ncbi:MAG: hypothetical protein M1825_002835 [Sarcosagium campestre]|nr:MAG: hypothetical protein M1825_002835 [Sarcosagium campestre]
MSTTSEGIAEASDTGDDSDRHGIESNLQLEQADSRPASPARRVEWSDDEGGDAYDKFKNRKALERKRSVASKGKARARTEAQLKVKFKSGKRRSGVTASSKSLGKRRQDADEEPGTKDFADAAIPSYLKDRRAISQAKMERLKESGLKLPPRYDDIIFSDDEASGDKGQAKPSFSRILPCSPYKDVTLPYSLGIIPASLAQWLREYQVQGVAFLHELFVYQKGGILGDDMGLGKTVQVLAFLTAAFGKTGDQRDGKRMRKMRRAKGAPWYPRVLVICPGSLIDNWKKEIDAWGWWHVDVFHGNSDSKEAALDSAAAGHVEILITTYATYRLNKDVLNMIEWDCVIADECHTMKERRSEISKSMNEVNALCRIGLTGTAIQNNYDELWTLLNWTNPGRFGPLSTWRKCISEPLKLGQSHQATVHQLSNARRTAKRLVQNLLPEFFLRRMKTLIADQLPKKSDRVVFCPLTQTQSDAYKVLVESPMVEYIKFSSELCECGSGKKRGWCCYVNLPDGTPWRDVVFPAIAALQKISNHLALLIPQANDAKDKQEKNTKLLQLTLPDQWRDLLRHRDSILNFSNPEFCGKWRVLKRLLSFWHDSDNGDKVLVFSHSKRLLRMLRSLFNHTSYSVSYLDGEMGYEDRAMTVDEFNNDPLQFVFLISTKAGGVGLNITSANKVVVVDPNWNPSHDLQAQDRAYRIGQVRDVEVFRLVSAGTIEEIVYARQIYKQQQANIGYNASTERRYFSGVQQKRDQKGEIFGMQNLFSYHGDNVVLRDIVNKTNVAESKAGVRVVDLNVDDADANADADDLLPSDNVAKAGTDDNDAAMSQFATMVANGDSTEVAPGAAARPPSRRTDAINAILAKAGVDYTHENSEVIGSSTVEAKLSRRAEQAAAAGAPGHDAIDKTREPAFGASQGSTVNTDAIKYHPPRDVMRRQFYTMARTFGFDSVVDFALVVEGMTQAQRRAGLDRFYRIRRQVRADKGKEKNIDNAGQNASTDDEVSDCGPVVEESPQRRKRTKREEVLVADDYLGNDTKDGEETEGGPNNGDDVHSSEQDYDLDLDLDT